MTKRFASRFHAAAALVFAATLVVPAMAQDADQLPGGASSLAESYGDWTVGCRIVTSDDASRRVCAMSQRQVNDGGQQVLAVELMPSQDGLAGVMVMPFGLAVTRPVSLRVDEGEPLPATFSTCLPAGCLVPIEAGSETLAAMRSGSVLTFASQTVDGTALELSVSLAGFTAAANRIGELDAPN